MKIKSKWVAGSLLGLALVLGLMPGSGLTANADGETETAVLPVSAGNYILTDDITVNSAWHPVDGITLNLGGHSITQQGTDKSNGSVIVVESGRTFTLKGNGNLTGGVGSNEGTYYVGGGVMVLGTFNMYGGTITGNSAYGGNGDEGGGVWVGNGGTFNMYGGSITGNSGAGGGVGIGVNGWNNGNYPGTFNMYGGSISGNSSTYSAGVRLNNGTFNMEGGSITGGGDNYDIRVDKDGNSQNKFNLSGNVTIGTIRFDGEMKANIAESITNDSPIIVYMDQAREFTNSSNVGNNDAERFTSGLNGYVVLKNSNGQLYLGSGYTVTYKVVNGTWSDDSIGNKTETVVSGSTPSSIPTGMKPSAGYKNSGAWSENPSGATITGSKIFIYTFDAKSSITPSVSIDNWTYGEAAKTPSITGSTGDGEVTYTYAKKGTTDFAATVPSDAGEYTVKAVIAETDNYLSGETTADFKINKADSVPATVTANNRTYNGKEKALVTVDESTLVGGAMMYALGTDDITVPALGSGSTTETESLWTDTIPTGKKSGKYYVWYKVVGDENHTDTAPVCVKVTIKKESSSDSGNETPGGGTTDSGSSDNGASSGSSANSGASGSGNSTAVTAPKTGDASGTGSFGTVLVLFLAGFVLFAYCGVRVLKNKED